MDDIGDVAAGLVMTLVLAVAIVMVFVFFAVLFLAGAGLVWFVRSQRMPPRGALAPPVRWFDAPPSSRWLAAYDYWLYQLENLTGITFTTSPTRLLVGAEIVSVGSALLAGGALALLDPGSGTSWLVGLGGTAAVIGGITGWKLAQPAPGWFTFENGHPGAQEPDGFMLGTEEW